MMEPWMFSCIHIGIRDTVVACFTVIDNLSPGCGWSSSTVDRLEDIHAYIGWIVWEKLIHPSSVHGFVYKSMSSDGSYAVVTAEGSA